MSPIWLEDNNLTSLAKMPFHPASENLPKIQFGEFVCSEWRDVYVIFAKIKSRALGRMGRPTQRVLMVINVDIVES
jgi:hypothetical protein